MNIPDKIAIKEVNLVQGQWPSLGIWFEIDGEIVERAMTASSLWVAIHEYHEKHVIEIPRPPRADNKS